MIKITEQPATKALRFRYECEGRSAGSIPGAFNIPENRTFPTIQILDYIGKAVVVVSCVTKDEPYIPHPHNLVGKDPGFKHGVFTAHINPETMSYTFKNLGIQCVKRKDIQESLKIRKDIKVDPFKRRTSTDNNQPKPSYDLSVIRLAFQVFCSGPEGKCDIPLEPVVSEPIYDKKSNTALHICKLSHCSASCTGGQEIILLCEKVAKEDIAVRFFEEIDGKTVWEDYGSFIQGNVHKQVGISLRTPKYSRIFLERVAKCFIQLKRPSDGETSLPVPFDFIPITSDTIELNRKRQRIDPKLLRNLQTLQLKQPNINPSIPVSETSIQTLQGCAAGYSGSNFNQNFFEEKPNNLDYIPNVREPLQNLRLQQPDPSVNFNFQCPNLSSQTINYNQIIISPTESRNIPENLNELIDPQYNPSKFPSGPLLDLLKGINDHSSGSI